MILFKNSKNTNVTEQDFSHVLEKFNLKGRTVMVYSRLLAFGRLQGKKAVYKIIDILQDSVGKNGCLIIPCHTFSGYNNEVFDISESKCKVGILGELARMLPQFTRTTHPIYSHVVYGASNKIENFQDETTCFGHNSFYDYYNKSRNPYILMLGTNLNALTNFHYYEQKYSAKSRFLKKFKAKIKKDNIIETEFESCVRDYEIYEGKVECFAKFDELLTEMKILECFEYGDDYIIGVKENELEIAYYNCLKDDPENFLFSSKEVYEEYYQMNKSRVFHDAVHSEVLKDKIISNLRVFYE